MHNVCQAFPENNMHGVCQHSPQNATSEESSVRTSCDAVMCMSLLLRLSCCCANVSSNCSLCCPMPSGRGVCPLKGCTSANCLEELLWLLKTCQVLSLQLMLATTIICTTDRSFFKQACAATATQNCKMLSPASPLCCSCYGWAGVTTRRSAV